MRKSNFVFNATITVIWFNAYVRLEMLFTEGNYSAFLIGALQGVALLIGFSFLFNVIEELRRSK